MRSIFEWLRPQKECPQIVAENKKRDELMREADSLTEAMNRATKRLMNGHASES